jgi:Tfp pilus assembly protein PilF
LTLYHNHNFEEATDHFRKAAEIEPDSTQAQLGLAMIARWQDNCPKAKNIYDILLQTYPKRGDIYYLRAECLAREDAIADALYDLDKAIDLGYETPQVFMLRGQLHIEQMDCISADFDFKKAQQLGASAKVVAAALLMCK